MGDLIAYNKKAAEIKKLSKNKKKEGFKKFATKINFRYGSKFVWGKCKVFKNSLISVQPALESSNLQKQEKVEEALKKLCPPWVPSNQMEMPR